MTLKETVCNDDEDNIYAATDDDNDDEDANKEIRYWWFRQHAMMVMMYYNDNLSKVLSNPVSITFTAKYCKRNENIELKKIIGLIWSLDKFTLL